MAERLSVEELEELHAHMAYGVVAGESQLNDHVLSAVAELLARRAATCGTCWAWGQRTNGPMHCLNSLSPVCDRETPEDFYCAHHGPEEGR